MKQCCCVCFFSLYCDILTNVGRGLLTADTEMQNSRTFLYTKFDGSEIQGPEESCPKFRTQTKMATESGRCYCMFLDEFLDSLLEIISIYSSFS